MAFVLFRWTFSRCFSPENNKKISYCSFAHPNFPQQNTSSICLDFICRVLEFQFERLDASQFEDSFL